MVDKISLKSRIKSFKGKLQISFFIQKLIYEIILIRLILASFSFVLTQKKQKVKAFSFS